MKIVINGCFGGFSLSPKAVKRLAELNGKECYFFEGFKPKLPVDGFPSGMFWSAYSVPNPPTYGNWQDMTREECVAANKAIEAVSIESCPDDRTDPLLIQVVEELGEEANGQCAKLKIIEIPDGMDYEIEEYDGNEHVAEKHRTWN